METRLRRQLAGRRRLPNVNVEVEAGTEKDPATGGENAGAPEQPAEEEQPASESSEQPAAPPRRPEFKYDVLSALAPNAQPTRDQQLRDGYQNNVGTKFTGSNQSWASSTDVEPTGSDDGMPGTTGSDVEPTGSDNMTLEEMQRRGHLTKEELKQAQRIHEAQAAAVPGATRPRTLTGEEGLPPAEAPQLTPNVAGPPPASVPSSVGEAGLPPVTNVSENAPETEEDNVVTKPEDNKETPEENVVTKPEDAQCPICNGSKKGVYYLTKCKECNGTGNVGIVDDTTATAKKTTATAKKTTATAKKTTATTCGDLRLEESATAPQVVESATAPQVVVEPTRTSIDEPTKTDAAGEEGSDAKKGDLTGVAAATAGICGVSLLTYNISGMWSEWTHLVKGDTLADPVLFGCILGIGAALLILGIGLAFCSDGANSKTAAVATMIFFQAGAISLITLGGFQQALGEGNHLIGGQMELFLLIGAGVLLLSLIFMGVLYKRAITPKNRFGIVVGSLLTVLVGGSATTIALSQTTTLLEGSAVWIGLGVGAFVLVAIVAVAFKTCSRYGGRGVGAMKDNNTGALVFAAWSGIIAVTGTGGAMIAQSTLGKTWESISSDPAIFIVGAGLVFIAIVTVAIGLCCRNKKASCGKLFWS